MSTKKSTHIAGTFLIQVDAAFLNGAGLGEGEDQNVTLPKTFRDGKNEVLTFHPKHGNDGSETL